MRYLALTLAVPVLAGATACAVTTGSGGDSGWPAGRTFISSSITGHTLVAGTRIALTFQKGGGISAQAGCNTMSGTGRLDGGRLDVSDVAQTEMGCDADRMTQDDWLAGFLTAKPSWRLAGDNLVLDGDPVRLTLTDRKVTNPDRSLTGTRWVVDTIITGDTAASVPSGAIAYLIFDGAGTVTGSTGCVPVTGSTTITGRTITFTGPPPPGRTCTTETGALDAAVRSTLRGTVAYAIDSDTLTLTGPDGHGLGLHATG